MIAFLEGRIEEVAADRIGLDVSGVGYELFVSTKTLSTLQTGEKKRLFVHMHIAEGILALYGFISREERTMFRHLISISRVGPKVAMAALSTLSPGELATAIILEDDSALGRVPGLGKKTAQRIILELKEKLSGEMADMPLSMGVAQVDLGGSNMQHEALSALIALGYDQGTATRAIKAVGEADRVEMLVASALRSLARG